MGLERLDEKSKSKAIFIKFNVLTGKMDDLLNVQKDGSRKIMPPQRWTHKDYAPTKMGPGR